MSKYLIIGPTKAGKTALLSILDLATTNPDEDLPFTLQVANPSPEMAELMREARETINNDGRFPLAATEKLTKFTFDLVVRSNLATEYLPSWISSNMWGWLRRRFNTERVVSFTWWDGPGGTLFPEEDQGVDYTVHQQFRDQLISELRQADGFILCVDATRGSSARAIFKHLPGIMHDTGLRTLPCKRVVACMTKVDAFFVDQGRNAQHAAQQVSPKTRSDQLLTMHGKGTLRNFCDPTARIAFGWSSAYGFLETGEPNYDELNNSLRSYFPSKPNQDPDLGDGDRKVIESWVPFRVLDPFIFLATGRQGTLEVYLAEEIK